jgi:hypothetical protein
LSSARTTRKDPKDRPKPINATADTVRSKPIFREAYRKRRCPLTASVAIDGSKFKAVNTRDKNFTRGKVGRRRRAQLEESAARYLAQLGTANRAGTVRRAGGQDGPSEGQIGQAGKRDAASGGDGRPPSSRSMRRVRRMAVACSKAFVRAATAMPRTPAIQSSNPLPSWP